MGPTFVELLFKAHVPLLWPTLRRAGLGLDRGFAHADGTGVLCRALHRAWALLHCKALRYHGQRLHSTGAPRLWHGLHFEALRRCGHESNGSGAEDLALALCRRPGTLLCFSFLTARSCSRLWGPSSVDASWAILRRTRELRTTCGVWEDFDARLFGELGEAFLAQVFAYLGSAYVAKFFEAMGAQSCQAFRLLGAPWTSRMHQQMGQDRCRIALEATAGLFESKIGRCEEARGVTARRQLCVACLPARVRRSAWRSTALWLLASLQSCWKLLAPNSAPTSWSCKTPTSVTASAA